MQQRDPILIYRLGSLGDTVVALPCYHLIRRLYPERKIVLLTNEPVSGKAAPAMAVLEHSGLCDDVLNYPIGTRNFNKLDQLRRVIRRLGVKTVINLAASRGRLKSVRDYFFLRACGASRIIGTPFYTRDIEVHKASDGFYESEAQRLANRLERLEELNLADPKLWKLELTPRERSTALEHLPSDFPPFIGMSIGTKKAANNWGEDNWEILLRRLNQELPDIALVLLGAPDEWERSERLARAWGGRYLNFCGKVSARISAGILEHARLFMGHDSGPLHLASTLGIPVLGLYAWGNPPGQWYPGHRSWKHLKVLYPPLPEGGWHPNLRDKRGPGEGILLLKPDAVFRSAMELLNTTSVQTA